MASHRAAARSQIGAYFGGAFDAVNRCYRDATGVGTPTFIPLVGTLRTHFTKRYPKSDHTYGLPKGSRTGGYLTVQLAREARRAITTGPTLRYKRQAYDVTLHLYVISHTSHAEDAQDDVDDILDAIVDRIDADRTLGSGPTGVFETGAGEIDQGIVITFGEPVTRAEVTSSYASIEFAAVGHELA